MSKYLNKKDQLRYEILGFIIKIERYQKIYNHVWRKHNQECRMKNIDEARNHLIEEINLNELMSKKYKRKLWFWIILSTYLY